MTQEKYFELINKRNEVKNQLNTLYTQVTPINRAISTLQNSKREIEDSLRDQILQDNQGMVKVLEDAGAEEIYVDFDNADDFKDAFEDDGTLHVVFGKVRGCFINNQDLPKSRWNVRASRIADRLNKYGIVYNERMTMN